MSERTQILRANQEVARILAESDSEHALYARVLAAMGEGLGWRLGAAWEPPPGADVLVCVETWCAPGAWPGARSSRRPRAGLARARRGAARAGVVDRRGRLDRGRPDPRRLPARGAPRRGPARRRLLPAPERARRARGGRVLHRRGARAGHRAARDDGHAGRPDRAGGGAPPDAEHLRARRQAARGDAGGGARRVVSIDEQGQVLEFNPAAERTFGYRADEAVGPRDGRADRAARAARAPPRRPRAAAPRPAAATCSAGASSSPACAPTERRSRWS